MQPLLLASASPRRRELLEQSGVVFEVVSASVTELDATSAPALVPAELAKANATIKARAAMRPGRWTLGADTVVARDNRLFGKPASLEEAREFLRALSGGQHEVLTGCALISPAGRETVFSDRTIVTFLPFDEATISRYLAEVHVLDKAGAYALQEHGDWLVKSVNGSESNVIGLPTELVVPLLREHGLA